MVFEFDKITCTVFDGVRVNPKMKPSHVAQSKDSFQELWMKLAHSLEEIQERFIFQERVLAT